MNNIKTLLVFRHAVIGDTQYDLAMFEVVDFKIAYNSHSEILNDSASVVLNGEELSVIIEPIEKWLRKLSHE